MPYSNNRDVSRRRFIKDTAAGAAAAGMIPYFFVPRLSPSFEGWESPHPDIDGLRVVGLHDEKMTTDELPTAPWKKQEQVLDAELIEANVDRLACTLADEKKPADAWKKIFVKPPKKGWSDTIVAIKTNNIARQHTRSPVMARVCRALVERGVKASNIYIYDSCHGKDMHKKTPFKGLPDKVNVVARWKGIKTLTDIPEPWHGGEAECIEPLVSDEVDILVNISMCKGHSSKFGTFTMTMKNHLGSFNPRPAHADGSTDYLIAINKTPEVLGKMDAKGKILFPRQQLCLVDCLWASEDGPMCEASAQPNRLFMGTFSPVLDRAVAQQFRRDVMEWSIKESVVKRFLTDFGLTAGDLPNGGKLIDALKA